MPLEDDAKGLETFYWKGQKRYRCPLMWEGGSKCKYDTYDLKELRRHMKLTPHTQMGDIAEENPFVPDSGFVRDVPPEK